MRASVRESMVLGQLYHSAILFLLRDQRIGAHTNSFFPSSQSQSFNHLYGFACAGAACRM